MKKVFVSLLLLMTAMASWALEVTFVPMGAATYGQYFCIEKDGVKLEITNGMDNGSQFRVYKNQQMIITSQVGTITQIVIECIASGEVQYGSGNFISNPPGYSYQDKIGLWQGASTTVTFTAVTNQVRFTKVIVTVNDDGLAKPVISPTSGTYYEPIEVTMRCYTQGATIHYTTDGSTPTTNSPQYTVPITLSNDATIKAISTLDGKVSDVVTASYEFIEPIPGDPGNCFSDFAGLPDGTVISYPSPIYAIVQHNNYLFVKDQCGGYASIYGNTGQFYTLGDVIPEGFVVTKTTYSGEPEYTNPANFKPATANVPIEPEEINANQVGHDLFGHYVVLHNVTIVKEGNAYYVIDENGNVVAVYFGSLGVSPPTDLERHYDLYAIVGSYGSNSTIYQLLPVKLVPHYYHIITLCDMDVMPDGETLTFDQEAIAIYQNGRYLYLKQGDFCYGLVYGDIGQTYNRGDIIPPGWGGTKTTYNGEPELKNPTGFSPSTSHVDVVPEVIRIPDIGHMTWAHYVRINGVHIDQERQVIIDSEGNSCPYYPKLPFQIDQTKIYNVTGIITSYGRTEVIYQFCFTDLGDLMPPPPIVCSISEAKQYNPEIIVQFECPLTVIYQNGMYLYVKDSCGEYGLIYGNAGGPFVNGDLIIGKAKGGTYSDNFQLNAVDDWVKIGHGDPVEPIETDYVEEIYQDMCHQYIRLEDVKIVFDENGNAHIEDETGIILLFDKFNIQVTHGGIIFTLNPCDVNWDGEVNIADINALIEYIISTPDECGPMRLAIDDIDPNITYDVEGFLSIYKSELELFPTMICPHYSIPYPKCRWDVNGDGEVTIADINCVIDAILKS